MQRKTAARVRLAAGDAAADMLRSTHGTLRWLANCSVSALGSGATNCMRWLLYMRSCSSFASKPACNAQQSRGSFGSAAHLKRQAGLRERRAAHAREPTQHASEGHQPAHPAAVPQKSWLRAEPAVLSYYWLDGNGDYPMHCLHRNTTESLLHGHSPTTHAESHT